MSLCSARILCFGMAWTATAFGAPSRASLRARLVADSGASGIAGAAGPFRDRSLRYYREVIVERAGRVLQRIPLDSSLPILDGAQQVRLTDFDGDGRADLVVLPKRASTTGTWLVFRFDAKTEHFSLRPQVFYSIARRTIASPGRGYRVERLLADEAGDHATDAAQEPVPPLRSILTVIHRDGEIAQVLATPEGDFPDRNGWTGIATASDVDFDGHPDLVLRQGEPTSTVTWSGASIPRHVVSFSIPT